MPLWILSFFAVFAGFLNLPHFEKFETWFQPRAAFVDGARRPSSTSSVAIISLAIAVAGGAIVVPLLLEEDGPAGLVGAEPARARRASTSSSMKYYLDVLYTDIIVGSIKGPIANGVYWFNQHVIDNVLNYAGKGAVGRRASSRTSTSTSAVSTRRSTRSRP